MVVLLPFNLDRCLTSRSRARHASVSHRCGSARTYVQSSSTLSMKVWERMTPDAGIPGGWTQPMVAVALPSPSRIARSPE